MDRWREFQKMFLVLQLLFLEHWPETTKGYAVIPVQYYIILNRCGQVKPTKFWTAISIHNNNLDLAMMCYKIVIGGITDDRRCEYYFLMSFLHESWAKSQNAWWEF